MRRGHPDVAEMARAAAHVREQLRLGVVAGSEEVVRALAADALGLEGQGALESLQLGEKKRERELMRNGARDERKTERINEERELWSS